MDEADGRITAQFLGEWIQAISVIAPSAIAPGRVPFPGRAACADSPAPSDDAPVPDPSASPPIHPASLILPDTPPPLRVFRRVASTNQTLWQWAEAGAASGSVAIALSQSGGRGQWGRTWTSPPGGLYWSQFLDLTKLPQPVPVANAPQLTLATAWGIAAQLRSHHIPVQIKWPNDLVVAGRKLGGILVETRVAQGAIARAVVGVGLNWRNPVPETGVALGAIAPDAFSSLEALAAQVWLGVARGITQWQQGGVESFLADYLDWLTHRNQPIPIPAHLQPRPAQAHESQSGQPQSGYIIGVTAQGELRLRLQPPIPNLSERDHDLTSPHPGSDLDELRIPPGGISLGYLTKQP